MKTQFKRVRPRRKQYEVQYRNKNKNWHYGGDYDTEKEAVHHATNNLAPYYDQVRVLIKHEIVKASIIIKR